jgi:hypothetical protein
VPNSILKLPHYRHGFPCNSQKVVHVDFVCESAPFFRPNVALPPRLEPIIVEKKPKKRRRRERSTSPIEFHIRYLPLPAMLYLRRQVRILHFSINWIRIPTDCRGPNLKLINVKLILSSFRSYQCCGSGSGNRDPVPF